MTISNPEVTFAIVGANVAVENSSQIALIVGQMLSTGSATPGIITTDIQNDLSENALFGQGSQVSEMIRAFKSINKKSRVDVLALADPIGGVKTSVATTFGGTATESGSFNIIIGSSLRHNYTVTVQDTDTGETVATNIAAAINDDLNAYFTATAVTGLLTITCRHAGLIGNDISAAFSGVVAGITVAVPTRVAGVGSPIFPDLNTVAGSIRYQTVVWPAQYPTNIVANNFLEPRWNPDNALLDGVAIIGIQETFASLKTLGLSLNLKSLVYLADKLVSGNYYAGGSIVEWKCVEASIFAAVRALRLTPGASISQYVTTTQGSDQFGGPAIASLPYANTPFITLPLVTMGNEWTAEEVTELQAAGISVLQNNEGYNTLIAGNIVTTYKTDVSFTFLNYVDTLSNVREYMRNNAKRDFAQARLTLGALQQGRNMQNEASIRTKFKGYYQRLGSTDYVLVQAGSDAVKDFAASLVVNIVLATGTVTVQMMVAPVTQLRKMTGTIGITFSTNS
jgi:phage tail sheath gpL-like